MVQAHNIPNKFYTQNILKQRKGWQNNRKHLFLSVLAGLCLALFACEKTIDFKTSYQKQLVCTGFIGQDGKTLVYLQLTHDPLDWAPDTTLIDATVSLQTKEIGRLRLEPVGFNYYELPQSEAFKEGDTLSIWIETSLFGLTYSSKVIIPQSVPIDSANIIQSNNQSQLQIFFSDLTGSNYYGIKKEWITEIGVVPPIWHNDFFGRVFNDEEANNGQMVLNEPIYLSHTINGIRYEAQQVRIILFHLSEQAYQFFTDLQYNSGEPILFMEPTIIYSNIFNGIGIFASFASDTITISLKP